MANYIIASTPDNPKLSHCQLLAEFAMANAPDVSVTCIIKDKSEWEDFVDAVVRSYGFDYKSDPLIYTLQGDLIGDGERFIDHLRQKYNVHLTLTKETLKNLTRKNIYDNEEKMRLRTGRTFGEQIEEIIGKKPKRNVANLITDSFYTQEWDTGCPFYVRRTDLLREEAIKKFSARRIMNVPDYDLEEKQEKAKIAEEEAAKDQTWDDFLKQYKRHIEKKIDPMERTGKRREHDFGHEKEDKEAVEFTSNKLPKKKKSLGVDSRDEYNSSKISDIIPESELKKLPDEC